MLHITNGDAAKDRILRSGIGGDVLPWRDVLHDGPVPAGLELEELSQVRAAFIVRENWGSREEVERAFRERDARLREGRHEAVVLWFEADLYDQLQLIQVLDVLAADPPAVLELICIGDHPAVSPFHGLGQLTPVQIAALYPGRIPVRRDQLDLAVASWRAFRQPEPLGLLALETSDTTPLPFLGDAIRRLLQEYPDTAGGLGRTERQILEILLPSPRTFAELFAALGNHEERPFLGDTAAWSRILRLSTADPPALQVEEPFSGQEPARLSITSDGRRYLEGTLDLVAQAGIDRWIGGVHLSGPPIAWRWDSDTDSLARCG